MIMTIILRLTKNLETDITLGIVIPRFQKQDTRKVGTQSRGDQKNFKRRVMVRKIKQSKKSHNTKAGRFLIKQH